jgi:hypothetical protein
LRGKNYTFFFLDKENDVGFIFSLLLQQQRKLTDGRNKMVSFIKPDMF